MKPQRSKHTFLDRNSKPMRNAGEKRRRNPLSKYGIGIILIVICGIFTLWTKGLFLQPLNIVNVLRQISINAILATGMTFVIISAGIDLSVGSVAALAGVFTAHLLHLSGLPVVAVIGIALTGGMLLGALCGAVNGFTITRFNVPPFISTLALMTAASGMAFIICGGRPVWNLPAEFNVLGRGYVLEGLLGPWLPIPVLIMLAIMAGAHVILTRTTVGRYIYAVGGNEEAARLSGINVAFIKMFVYAFSGITAACGGILLASRLASGQPNAGVSYELYAIAATVVGGTSLSGGEGSIPGTLIGALIIGVLSNGMNLAGVESYLQKVILGVILLGAVMLDQARKKST
ncbi:MAG: ABC transporter permease [Chitinispirillaceae bacterium]|nr:ABC transporter permease [Chitinispirillaceae bacterium]